MADGHYKGPQSEESNLRGIELADRGWLEEALREFDRAIDLDRNAPFPRINRASVYLEQGRTLEALADLISAVGLAPEDPATRYHLGLFLSRHGLELGIGELQTALNLDPEHVDALLQLGATHAERGEMGKAEEAIVSALQIDPQDPLANREMGILHLDRGRVHEAIDSFKTAHRAAPEDLETIVDLGVAYLQAGFMDKAADLLNSVIERDPRNVYAHYNLSAIASEAGKAQEACHHMEQALQSDRLKVSAWVKDDPLFESMRKNEQFQSLLLIQTPDMG